MEKWNLSETLNPLHYVGNSLDLGMSLTAQKIRLQMASWDPTSRLVSNGCTLVISPFGAPFHIKGYSGHSVECYRKNSGFLVDLGEHVFPWISLCSLALWSQFLCFKMIQSACEKTQTVREATCQQSHDCCILEAKPLALITLLWWMGEYHRLNPGSCIC